MRQEPREVKQKTISLDAAIVERLGSHPARRAEELINVREPNANAK